MDQQAEPIVAAKYMTAEEVMAAIDKHADEAADERDRADRRVRNQFVFLLALLVLAGVLLAYRTEVNYNEEKTNAHAIEVGIYNACSARADLAVQYNEGREALVQLAVGNPNSTRPPAERAKLAQQLRDGLLLPIEDCGDAP